MRIQSKFRDYYDYISHRYGSDPGCTYARGPISNTCVEWPDVGDFRDTLKPSVPFEIDFVVAGSHVVPMLSHFVRQYDCTGDSTSVRSSARLQPGHGHLLHEDWLTKQPMWPLTPSGERLSELIRLVGAPVFRVWKRQGKHLVIDERVPILKDLGFPSLFAPEVIWQDIYTTLTSVLRRDSDKAPPVEVSEKIRIEYAGFDLKSLFRHPVNPKKVK